ncbi:MAG: dephospho-CoA kinase [Tannerellaceae bacterium]|jgi:dephospho-CoA kinase|nr:dephospho-CoA kinase [Tannerellaceae bacterium]
MIRIGLTGGIGSGKSMVASLLEVLGVPVYEADAGSKRLIGASALIRRRLTDLLGESVYNGAELDRKRLADCIFNDPEILKQVNAIIHPEVGADFLDWASRQTAAICAIETAILFESGFDCLVDMSVMVYAPVELRTGRVVARDGVSREDVLRRMRNQWPDEVKKARSDYIIYNDGRQALLPQLNKLLADMPAAYSRR